MKQIWTAFFFILSCVSMSVGCGDDSPTEEVTCESVNRSLCERACECTEGEACQTTLGEGGTLTHDDEADCITFWVTFGCMQEAAENVDYPLCADQLEAAECVESAAQGLALNLPSSCSTESN